MSNIALQIERQLEGMVGSLQNVIFNSTVFTAGNIMYNAATGIITFMEVGRYTLNWWIATQSSVGQGTVFSLISSQGESIKGASPVKTGEVSGFGIIEVTSEPVTVSLVNTGSAEFYYSSILPVKAALMIVENNLSVPQSYVQLFDRNYTNELTSPGALNLSNEGINPVYSTAGYSLTTTTVMNDTLNLPGPGLYQIELSLRASFLLPLTPPLFGSTYQVLFNLLNEVNSNAVDLIYNGIIPNDPNAILDNQLSIQLLYNTVSISPSLRVILSNFDFNLAFENKLSVFDIIFIVQKL